MENSQILWKPAGTTLPYLGRRALTDISDGDTPNIRMPIRMLSIDTPEVTAKSEAGATKVDANFRQLAAWIRNDQAPVTQGFADHILPKLENVDAGTLQYQQGKQASAHHNDIVAKRLTRPSGSKRKLYIRSAEQPFDSYGRLLAYVAPAYSNKELALLSRKERSTFNLDMVASGWAAPFLLYPCIPNEFDLPLFIEAVENAISNNLGQHANPLSMPGYEYRMCEKLFKITNKLVQGDSMSSTKQQGWRSRYCADMRNRKVVGAEAYMTIPEPYRLWIWPDDIQDAIAKLNLIPNT